MVQARRAPIARRDHHERFKEKGTSPDSFWVIDPGLKEKAPLKQNRPVGSLTSYAVAVDVSASKPGAARLSSRYAGFNWREDVFRTAINGTPSSYKYYNTHYDTVQETQLFFRCFFVRQNFLPRWVPILPLLQISR